MPDRGGPKGNSSWFLIGFLPLLAQGPETPLQRPAFLGPVPGQYLPVNRNWWEGLDPDLGEFAQDCGAGIIMTPPKSCLFCHRASTWSQPQKGSLVADSHNPPPGPPETHPQVTLQIK